MIGALIEARFEALIGARFEPMFQKGEDICH